MEEEVQVPIAKDYELPREGLHRARVVEVVHKGLTKTDYGMKDQLTVVWIICDQTDAGGDELVYKQNLTNKVHPTSHFYKLIQALGFRVNIYSEHGKTFGANQLVGKEIYIDVVHSKRNGRVYADVVGYSETPRTQGVAVSVVEDAIGGKQ